MVNMKYTKFVIGEFKKKIFGEPKPAEPAAQVAIPVYTDPVYSDQHTEITPAVIVEPKEEPSYSSGSPMNVASLAIFAVVGLIMITVFGSVYSALNTTALPAGTESMLGLIPIIMVGAVMIGIITMVLKIM
jgi:hypothetical protein